MLKNAADHSDVWATSNGVDWECVSPACQWEARSYHEVAVWDHKLWLLEGYTPPRYSAVLFNLLLAATVVMAEFRVHV